MQIVKTTIEFRKWFKLNKLTKIRQKFNDLNMVYYMLLKSINFIMK